MTLGFKKQAQGIVLNDIRPPLPSLDQQVIDKAFARCFSTQDGQLVLSHLQALTFQRAHMPTAAEAEIRYSEGQRALVASILRMVNRGKDRG